MLIEHKYKETDELMNLALIQSKFIEDKLLEIIKNIKKLVNTVKIL